MKLGFLTACLPDLSLDSIIDYAVGEGYQALEVAAWPDLGDRPFTATHIAAERLRADDADAIRAPVRRGRTGAVLAGLLRQQPTS